MSVLASEGASRGQRAVGHPVCAPRRSWTHRAANCAFRPSGKEGGDCMELYGERRPACREPATSRVNMSHAKARGPGTG